MCIALVKSHEAILTPEIALRCAVRHPHGFGFGYAKDGQLHIKKGFFEFEKFWDEFDKIQKENEVIVHFRHATHGKVNVANCHPWRIDREHAVVHNGIIFEFAYGKSNISDTGHSVREVLRPLFREYRRFWRSEIGKFLLEQSIGYYCKAVILSNTGKISILNEDQGIWEADGIWYSNDSYREVSSYLGTDNSQLKFPFDFEDVETKRYYECL